MHLRRKRRGGGSEERFPLGATRRAPLLSSTHVQEGVCLAAGQQHFQVGQVARLLLEARVLRRGMSGGVRRG